MCHFLLSLHGFRWETQCHLNRCFSISNVSFTCFQDFSLLFSFWKCNYDVSGHGFLCLYPPMFVQQLERGEGDLIKFGKFSTIFFSDTLSNSLELMIQLWDLFFFLFSFGVVLLHCSERVDSVVQPSSLLTPSFSVICSTIEPIQFLLFMFLHFRFIIFIWLSL